MPLTDTTIRNAKSGDKPIRLFDGGGLYVEVQPSGHKWWRLKYRYGGKEKRLSLGVYPTVSLRDARERREKARKLLADRIDPSANRKAEKNSRADREANSFEMIAREWMETQAKVWSEDYAKRKMQMFERDIFPKLGSRPITEITAPDLLAVLRKIEAREAAYTAHRALADGGSVFRYAIATGRAERNPAADLRGALSAVVGTHFAATTEPDKLIPILRMIDGYEGTLTVRCALQLAPLVFVRPGELRKAKWDDVDLGKAEWRYFVTKTKTQHVVPLADQAVAILRELHQLTGRGQFVFPNARSNKRPMSDNAILAAMRRIGIGPEEMTGHGFRAVARTILDEVLGFRPDFIEHQLAHAVRDPNGRAYNRTAHLEERRKMMQAWADYLDRLKKPGEIVQFPQNASA